MTFEKQKTKFLSMVMAKEALILQGKAVPTIPQEIPALFEGSALPASKAVQTALWIAKNNDLIARKTPLRSVWYDFIKLVLQKIIKRVRNPADSFYKSFGDIIRKTDLWYKDFNVVNEPAAYTIVEFPGQRLFPNIMICLEKESYYQVFKNFCDLLGLHLYAGGGMPSYSAAEDISRKIHNAALDEDLDIYTISDYDPVGFDIANTFEKHFSDYLDRFGTQVKSERKAPYPYHYTEGERERGMYGVKPVTVDRKRWKQKKYVDERLKYGVYDERFKDPNFYDTDKDSEIHKFLDEASEGKMKKPSRDAWINKWRVRAEQGDFPHVMGFEVESLPGRPFDEQLPPDYNPADAVGRARMRLIIFDELIESYKLEDVLEKWLENNFITEPEESAKTMVKKSSRYLDIDSIKENIKERLDNLMDMKFNMLFGSDVEEVKKKIEDWREDLIKEYVVDSDKIKEFENALRVSIADDEDSWNFAWKYNRVLPSIPDTVTEDLVIPDEVNEAIDDNRKFLDDLLEQVNKKIEEEIPEDEKYKEEFEESETEETSRFTIEDKRNKYW